jgi:hypothetical protein
VVVLDEKFGYIDNTGKEGVPPKYNSGGDFIKGMAPVNRGGQYGYIDKSGYEIVPLIYEFTYIPIELAAMVISMAEEDPDLLDTPFISESPQPVISEEGLAAIVGDGKWGFIDNTGKLAVPLTYDYAFSFSEGMAAVNRRDKWGFISVNGASDTAALPPAPPPAAPAPATPTSLEGASAWARTGIASAIAKGFVPEDLQSDYTRVITRGEFCRMAVGYMEYASGTGIDRILSEKGLARDPSAFSDTDDPYILAAYALGVVSGTGDGKFTPEGEFTREQAATMIMNVRGALGRDISGSAGSGFADAGSISSWAADGINYCAANGIMSGTGDNNFSPQMTYTIEQSIVTFDNMK